MPTPFPMAENLAIISGPRNKNQQQTHTLDNAWV